MAYDQRFASSASGWTNSSTVTAADSTFASDGWSRTLVEGVWEPVSTLELVSLFSTLSVPAGSTITGIYVDLSAYRSAGPSGGLSGQLYKSGVAHGSSKLFGELTEGGAALAVGGSADLWGGSWSVADLANLSLRVWADPTSGSGSGTVYIDYVRITVYYNDTTPDSFDFTDLTDQTLATVVGSGSVTVSGIDASTSVSVSGVGSSEWRKNGGSWTSAAGTVVNGDTVEVRHNTGTTPGATVTTTLTIGGVAGSFSTTASNPDTTPDAFSFGSVSAVEPSSVNTSGTATITGINTSTSVSVTSGEYSKNGGAWSSAATTCVSGDTFALRGTASATYGATVSPYLTVGGVNGFFSITTRDADTYPDAFTFTDLSGQTPSAADLASNEITISGIEAASSVSFSTSGTGTSHQYRKFTGGSWGSWAAVASTTVANGEKLQVRMTAPSGSGASGSITMNVGGRADTFTVTTTTGDTTPDAFTFVDEPNAAVSATVNSSSITVTGIDAAATVTFATGGTGSSHKYRKNGGAWTALASFSVVAGDTLELQLVAPATATQTATITPTIGGVADTWTVTATPPDSTPNAFAFDDVSGADLLAVTASSSITVLGINTSAAISISGGGAQYRINGGAWTSVAGTVVKNDTVELQLTSGAAFASTVSTTLTIGGVSAIWRVTTRSPDSAKQYVVTFREAVYGADF